MNAGRADCDAGGAAILRGVDRAPGQATQGFGIESAFLAQSEQLDSLGRELGIGVKQETLSGLASKIATRDHRSNLPPQRAIHGSDSG